MFVNPVVCYTVYLSHVSHLQYIILSGLTYGLCNYHLAKVLSTISKFEPIFTPILICLQIIHSKFLYMQQPQNLDKLKNEDNLQYEVNLKNEDDLYN